MNNLDTSETFAQERNAASVVVDPMHILGVLMIFVMIDIIATYIICKSLCNRLSTSLPDTYDDSMFATDSRLI